MFRRVLQHVRTKPIDDLNKTMVFMAEDVIEHFDQVDREMRNRK
jgi:hypothetical protein